MTTPIELVINLVEQAATGPTATLQPLVAAARQELAQMQAALEVAQRLVRRYAEQRVEVKFGPAASDEWDGIMPCPDTVQ